MDSKQVAAELMAALDNYMDAKIDHAFGMRSDSPWSEYARVNRTEAELLSLIEKLLEGRDELPR